MRLLSRVLVILVVCLIAITLPAVPAQAQECGGPFIEVSPKSGAPGTEVAVVGERFYAGKYVDIYYGGTRESDIVGSGRTSLSGGFTILFTIPEGYQRGYQVHAKVGANVGYDTADTMFTVKPGLTISLDQGAVGTNVTVKGQGFAENEDGIELYYYLNGIYETVESNIRANAKGSWETSFQIPSSTSGEHKLDAEGAVSRLYDVEDTTFKVMAEISIDKSSGSAGENITMTGSRFVANERGIKILFDGEALVTDIGADDEGNWEESFEVPDMPTGEYIVTAEGEQTRKEDLSELYFNIGSSIILSPDEGYVGMNLTVTGRGFAANEDVDIMYDGSQVATVETNDEGSFYVSFTVPESKYGEHQVRAKITGDNNSTANLETNASAMFTMESDPPPLPELISPPDGGRIGIRGKITPTFEWSEVPDDSGVCYTLQIATNENVTATGKFTDPLVSVTGLVGTSYTLEETEALTLGTYYWIVQAVDGAENESGWTAANALRIGLLPQWAFITIIVVIAVLLVALIRHLVLRRTIYYDRW
jgi:hypothetical protein